MKKYLSAILMATISLGAFADGKPAKKDKKEPQGYQFTDVKVNKTTPVKDQNKSGTCWSFSGISFLEDELLRITGKEYDLSEMWVVRHCYNDKADKYVRMEGKINFAQGGGTTDVGYVYDRYGMVPESAYRGLEYGEEKHDHYEMEPALRGIVDAVNNKKGKKSTAWKKAFNGVLDAYLGKLPETFEYEGKTYTPQSFAKMLNLNMADYIPVTSYTHHPFYTTFPLEIADNWLWEDSYNVPLEEMKAIVDNALDNGYSIAWGADVSEPGFKWTDGYAVLPKKKTEADLSGTVLARWVTLSDKERENENNDVSKPREEIVVTQDLRQEMFDNHETTDDHGMVIMGKAVDQNGTRYYKVKNSWDTNQKYGGFFYVSEPYFMGKTMSILVHRDAIPAEIAAKMNLPKK